MSEIREIYYEINVEDKGRFVVTDHEDAPGWFEVCWVPTGMEDFGIIEVFQLKGDAIAYTEALARGFYVVAQNIVVVFGPDDE